MGRRNRAHGAAVVDRRTRWLSWGRHSVLPSDLPTAMPDRRAFLQALPYPAVAAALAWPLDVALRAGGPDGSGLPDLPRDGGGPEDEPFWAEVQRAFTVDRSLINLNNGGVSPAPAYVQEAMKRHLDYSNQAPTHTMWRVLEPQIETVRQMLADRFGCDTEEIAITRGASEGLQICQSGMRSASRRSGADVHAGLSAHDHDVAAAGAARRDRAGADPARRSPRRIRRRSCAGSRPRSRRAPASSTSAT